MVLKDQCSHLGLSFPSYIFFHNKTFNFCEFAFYIKEKDNQGRKSSVPHRNYNDETKKEGWGDRQNPELSILAVNNCFLFASIF